MSSSNATLEVLDPVAKEGEQIAVDPAPRLTGFDGKKIGLYWNTKAGGDVALDEVSRLLQSRFKDLEFETFSSASWDRVSTEVLEQMVHSKCEAFVSSTAD